MKSVVKYHLKFVIITIAILLMNISCQENETRRVEKNIATQIAEYIIDKDSLKLINYSNSVFLHIKSEKLNDNNFKTFMSLNSLQPTVPESQIERISIAGMNIIVYYSLQNEMFTLDDAFFVPDSRSWTFLSEYYDDDTMFSELIRVRDIDDSEPDLNDEIDF